MQSHCLSRAPCVATHLCRCSGLRPSQVVALSSVHQTSGLIPASTIFRSTGCAAQRPSCATRAESGNGASPSTSGLPIDLTGLFIVLLVVINLRYCALRLASEIITILYAGKKAFIAGVADDQACRTHSLFMMGSQLLTDSRVHCRALAGPLLRHWQKQEPKYH